MTDDSDMDVRLGMEGSASLAAESTWPPWEVGRAKLAAGQQGPSWAGGGPHRLGWRGSPPPGQRVHSMATCGVDHHPRPASSCWGHPAARSPTTCPDLVDEADSITDVELVVNIPDLIPQPVGRFPHQELAQVLLVELFPPATR